MLPTFMASLKRNEDKEQETGGRKLSDQASMRHRRWRIARNVTHVMLIMVHKRKLQQLHQHRSVPSSLCQKTSPKIESTTGSLSFAIIWSARSFVCIINANACQVGSETLHVGGFAAPLRPFNPPPSHPHPHPSTPDGPAPFLPSNPTHSKTVLGAPGGLGGGAGEGGGEDRRVSWTRKVWVRKVG